MRPPRWSRSASRASPTSTRSRRPRTRSGTPSWSKVSSAGSPRSPATPRCRSSPTPGRRASWQACSRSAATTTPVGTTQRDVCLIPSSAHGTNAASAVMAGMRVVVVKATDEGSVDLDDLREKCATHADQLAAIMVTYPSTHGVYEHTIVDLCQIVHDHGGQVYVDGANLNALLGLAKPGQFGGDVSHLNLHKTFCIPHGGGGPGVGPVGVAAHLAPYLPQPPDAPRSRSSGRHRPDQRRAVRVRRHPADLVGLHRDDGRRRAHRRDRRSRCCRPTTSPAGSSSTTRCSTRVTATWWRTSASSTCGRSTKASGVSVDDVAKRLVDYGFHAPTMSFPVPGTFMIEPTESESLAEIDRFIDAMIAIRAEIADVEEGRDRARLEPTRARSPHDGGDHRRVGAQLLTRGGCLPGRSLRRQVLASGRPASTRPTAIATWSARALILRRSPTVRDRGTRRPRAAGRGRLHARAAAWPGGRHHR